MTSGFDYIVASVSGVLRRFTKLGIQLDDDSLDMLNELVQGQAYSVEELASRLLTKAVHEYYRATDKNVQHWESLSERQQEVAALVCLGYTNAQVAEKLYISPETVKSHVSEILRRFSVRGRHQLRYILKRWDFSGFDS